MILSGMYELLRGVLGLGRLIFSIFIYFFIGIFSSGRGYLYLASIFAPLLAFFRQASRKPSG